MKWFKYFLLSGLLAGGAMAVRSYKPIVPEQVETNEAASIEVVQAEFVPEVEKPMFDPTTTTDFKRYSVEVRFEELGDHLVTGAGARLGKAIVVHKAPTAPVIKPAADDSGWNVVAEFDGEHKEGAPILFSRCLSEEFTSIGLKPDEKAAGWKLLFDGTSLNGWNSWKTKQPLKFGAWKAEGGDLVLSGKGGGDIYTAAGYENYELVLEWKTTGNSGILLRVDPSHKGAIWNKAPEMQVDKGNPKAKNSTSAGGLYGLYDFAEEKVFHPDDWNHVKVRCKDSHFTIWFNHKQAHEFTVGSDDWKARVAKSKFKKFEGFGELKKGHIGLQDHGRSVRYRNIKIREL